MKIFLGIWMGEINSIPFCFCCISFSNLWKFSGNLQEGTKFDIRLLLLYFLSSLWIFSGNLHEGKQFLIPFCSCCICLSNLWKFSGKSLEGKLVCALFVLAVFPWVICENFLGICMKGNQFWYPFAISIFPLSESVNIFWEFSRGKTNDV